MGNVILGLSAIGSGLALFLAWTRLQRIVRARHWFDLWNLLTDVGVAGIMLTLAWRIFGVRNDIPLSVVAVVYGAFLLLIVVGLVGIAWTQGRHDKRASDREGVEDDEET